MTRAAIGVEGTSIVECTIRRNGEVTDCDMVQSVPATDALVLEAVTAWKMEPVRCGGVPTDARYRIPLRFWIPPARPPRPVLEGVRVLKDCPNGEMAKPRIISGDAPRFSAQAREARVWGTAIVQCVLRKTGALTDCWVVRRLPYMDEELLRAFSTWKVEPARCGGEPIDLWYNIPIRIPLRQTMPLGSSGELSDR